MLEMLQNYLQAIYDQSKAKRCKDKDKDILLTKKVFFHEKKEKQEN